MSAEIKRLQAGKVLLALDYEDVVKKQEYGASQGLSRGMAGGL